MATYGFAVAVFVALLAFVALFFVPLPQEPNSMKLGSIHEITAKLIGLFSKKDDTSNKNPRTHNEHGSQSVSDADRLFTIQELNQHDGRASSPGLYLAIMGKVFDVKKGKKHYAPGGGYSFFTGRDGSRAFISGDFTEEGLIADVEGLTPTEMVDLEKWVKFFEDEYVYVGKLIGHFYDDRGRPTANLKRAHKVIAEGKKQKEDEAAFQQKFPPCNSEWRQDTGSRVWCSQRSGGIQREWTGVPRKLFSPGTNKWRCACIKKDRLDNPHLREYDGCDPKSVSCHA